VLGVLEVRAHAGARLTRGISRGANGLGAVGCILCLAASGDVRAGQTDLILARTLDRVNNENIQVGLHRLEFQPKLLPKSSWNQGLPRSLLKFSGGSIDILRDVLH
jgi:hypothetical protein